MVEKRLGKGRVIAFTTPVDGEWNNWPSDPSYVVTILELARYLARSTAAAGDLPVGVPLRRILDPSRYGATARMLPPTEEDAVSLRALPTKDGRALQLAFEETDRCGFYRLELDRRDGEAETALFAVNLDPAEGDLRPVPEDELRVRFGAADIKIVRGDAFLAKSAQAAKTEIWRAVLVALVLTLCVEQFLGWWFGKRM